MIRLAVAPAARADLQDIRRYNKAAFGGKATLAYLSGLRDRFEALLPQPMLGRAEPDLGADIRSLGYRSHRIFYRLSEGEILILRVLHHARDVQRQFPPI